nr:hypothetical protein CFP56_19261 [Quercus suber]
MASQLGRLGNLPQIQEANSILARLDALQSSMDRKIDNLQTSINTLHTSVHTLDTKLNALTLQTMASAHNTLARLYNGQLDRAEHHLRALHNATTNEAILEFPSTPGEVERLSSRRLDDILVALGEDAEGNVPHRRQAVRRAIGMAQRGI